jgi:hypothetical protein
MWTTSIDILIWLKSWQLSYVCVDNVLQDSLHSRFQMRLHTYKPLLTLALNLLSYSIRTSYHVKSFACQR